MNFWKLIKNFLVPEDTKIQRLLDLEPHVMKNLLPPSPVNMKDVFVLFDYGNKIVKILVKAIKYQNNESLRKRLAVFLHDEIIELSSEISLFDGSPPIIVPMPMSKNEKRKRGFNQCEEILKEIQKLDENIGAHYDILKKIRETKRQTDLSREEREKNVKNSQTVSDSDKIKIQNRTVIVLDDVYTTLASFSEARRALLEAGAKRVIGLFIAH